MLRPRHAVPRRRETRRPAKGAVHSRTSHSRVSFGSSCYISINSFAGQLETAWGAKRAPNRQVLPRSLELAMSILTRKAILAVAAVIEIALSAQPMAGQTWRCSKDWRYDICSRC